MSQDNININVEETNDIVNIVSSEVTEVIDINVGETIEEVTLNITEEVIQVNINKITTTVTENLQQVTDNGNVTTNDIQVENANYFSIVQPSDVGTENKTTGAYTYIGADGVLGLNNGDIESTLKNTNVINAVTLEFPNKPTGTYTIATTEDTSTQVNSDWDATTGVAEILNKPTIPAAQIQSDWNQTNNVSLDYIKNKPSLTGFGDMLKSTYDVDNTGIVDNAEAIKIIGRNSTGSTLYRGTIIYINGSTGNRPNFVKARANSEATSAGTFGVIADDLANNTDGYALCLGYLDNLDTRTNATHPFTSDTLVDGDTIYLSPTTAGYITNIKPSAPDHLVYLGKVTRTHPSLGTIVYRIQNGYELEELHNVAISSVANYDGIFYNSSTSLWENKNVSQVLPERRNANKSSDNNINYCGMANKGSAEASAVWTIKRLTIGTSGSITIATATNVAWTNRESATYI